MSPVRASLQRVFVESLELMLRPIAKLTLHCGLGYKEFSAVTKRVFVKVASEEYGLRGRPANSARIAAVTGLTRKQVRSFRIDRSDPEWTPDFEVSPLNTIIHYWRFDERFCVSPGIARSLDIDGDTGFSALVRSYAGDIPESTIRQTLISQKIAKQGSNGRLILEKDYSFPAHLDEDFLRNAAFAIRHHAETIVQNAVMVELKGKEGFPGRWPLFERIAWSRRISQDGLERLEEWVQREGSKFIQEADNEIAQNENVEAKSQESPPLVTGVGLYFFRS